MPALIARIPEPTPKDGEDPQVRYAPVAARPGLWWRAACTAAVAGALLGGAVGLDWPLLFLLPLVPVSVALAVVDLHTHLLPTKVVWPTLAGTVALAAVAAAGRRGPARVRPRGHRRGAGLRALPRAVVDLPGGHGVRRRPAVAVVGFVLGYFGWAELLIGVYGAFLVFAVLGVVRARRYAGTGRRCAPRCRSGRSCWAGSLVGVVVGGPVWGASRRPGDRPSPSYGA